MTLKKLYDNIFKSFSNPTSRIYTNSGNPKIKRLCTGRKMCCSQVNSINLITHADIKRKTVSLMLNKEAEQLCKTVKN